MHFFFRMNNSIKSRLLIYFSISMIIIIISLGFVLYNSLKLQHIADRCFEDEQFLQEIQLHLLDLQVPLQNYLTSYSSSSLSKLLYIIEILNESIPFRRIITPNDSDLIKREIFFLLDNYLSQLNQIIEQKRGCRVQEYTENYQNLGERAGINSCKDISNIMESVRTIMILQGSITLL